MTIKTCETSDMIFSIYFVLNVIILSFFSCAVSEFLIHGISELKTRKRVSN